MQWLEAELGKLQDTPRSRRILLNHYPIFTNSFAPAKLSGRRISEIAAEFHLYLSGHLHELAGGLGKELLAIHALPNSKSGLKDLEVGDLEHNGMFRLGVFTNDPSENGFTFTDFSILKSTSGLASEMDTRSGIYLHVIHPKDSRFENSACLDTIIIPNYIQLFVFGAVERVFDVEIRINNTIERINTLDFSSLPLLQIPFDFRAFKDRQSDPSASHLLQVSVLDNDGTVLYVHSHRFKLDGMPEPLVGIGPFLMRLQVCKILDYVYWVPYLTIAFLVLGVPAYSSDLFDNFAIFRFMRSLLTSICVMFSIPVVKLFWTVFIGFFPVLPLLCGKLLQFSDILSVSLFANGGLYTSMDPYKNEALADENMKFLNVLMEDTWYPCMDAKQYSAFLSAFLYFPAFVIHWTLVRAKMYNQTPFLLTRLWMWSYWIIHTIHIGSLTCIFGYKAVLTSFPAVFFMLVAYIAWKINSISLEL